ncbi:MAG: FtsX-like permease family protein [Phocaeicola plebeius]
MKTFYRNFTHTFQRFFTASILNIVGLTIAFASFLVILTQVDYDYHFNRGYRHCDRIVRAEFYPNADWGWSLNLPRPFAELIGSCSPHVEATAILQSWRQEQEVEVDGHLFTLNGRAGFGNFLKVFQPEMLAGTTESLNEAQTIVIPASTAERLFGTTDAVGKTLFQGKDSEKKPLYVGGVYRDFPENTTLGNPVFYAVDKNENQDNWQNWNYDCYFLLDAPEAADEVCRTAFRKLKELPEEQDSTYDIDEPLHFTPLANVHFSPLGTKNPSSPVTMYLLFSVSFLIVLIAAINYMNFSLAETPMRIRSINTQKVLGAHTLSLRANLLAESVVISIGSFLLSLLLIYVLRPHGLQELVAASLDLTRHPALLAGGFGISLLMGVLAGLYPSYYVTSFPPALALKGSFGLSPKGRALRTTLVCFQFAVSFTLIISIGIMYAQSRYIRTSDYGYDKDEILVGRINQEMRQQREAIHSEVTRLSGVADASFSQFLISSGDSYMGWGRGEGDRYMQYDCLPVDEHYLSTMGIHITDGRDFKAGDKGCLIFNEAARRKYSWLRVDERPAGPGDLLCVGFCEDTKYSSFRNDASASPMAFCMLPDSWGFYPNYLNVRVQKDVDKRAMLHTLQQVVGKFSPGFDCEFRFMDSVLDNNYRQELRFTKQILLFSLVAIVLSIIGVFGLTLFESEYRRKEIGIRKIMGSSTTAILYMFNRRYIYILTGCFAVAAPFGWWIGHSWLEGFADKAPIHPVIFLAAFLSVSLLTLLTVTYQSWKNANENPIHSIKTE